MFSLLHRLDSSWFTQEGPSAFPSQHKPGTSLSTSVLFTLSAFVQLDKSESGESFELSRILVLSILAHPLIICFAMMVYSITLSDLKC